MIPRLTDRAAGILLHPSSLANDYPIGDLGPSARDFIDFLAAAGLRWWQMLPIGPIGTGNSPYQSFSSFGGNTLLVSPDDMAQDGWLHAGELGAFKGGPKGRVNYETAQENKRQSLWRAFERFEKEADDAVRKDLEHFVYKERSWLPDFALFAALRFHHKRRPWWTWENDVRKRKPAAIAAARKQLDRDVRYHQFVQWQFARQWQGLRAYAAERGVGLIGDLPIFVSADSSDVWSNPGIFTLRPDGSPARVAGVPPDYFAKTGQLWGNPHYRWDVLKKNGYRWWLSRLDRALRYFDALRVDHFIGFVRYYDIDAAAPTAEHGTYKAGPGADFFKVVGKKLGARRQAALIVEDLGTVTPEVKELRDRFGFPGMKVLQFAFGSDPEAKNYQPHNFCRHCVVYTGTHDNNTTLGWFKRELKEKEVQLVLRYTGNDGREIQWDMIRLALASIGNTAIVPMQDVLGLGPESRMNTPGTSEGNWEWRLTPGCLTAQLASRLRQLAETYGRI